MPEKESDPAAQQQLLESARLESNKRWVQLQYWHVQQNKILSICECSFVVLFCIEGCCVTLGWNSFVC